MKAMMLGRPTMLLLPLAGLLQASCSLGDGGLAASSPPAGADGPALQADATVTPEPATPPAGMVTFPSGRVFFVGLAIDPADQARGYMFRRSIDPEEGLLFIYKEGGVRTFWMKNCHVPLDIIWLDRDNRVVYIEREAPPCHRDPCPSFGPASPTFNVLEVAGGTAGEEGLKPGDHLQILTDSTAP